jgi:hypothetical protein
VTRGYPAAGFTYAMASHKDHQARRLTAVLEADKGEH